MIATLIITSAHWSFDIPGQWYKEEWVEPNSYSFVCMVCGDLWARSTIEGREYRAALTICPTCPSDGIHCPGSLLMWFPLTDQAFVDSLPAEVWQREVEIHCRHAERGL